MTDYAPELYDLRERIRNKQPVSDEEMKSVLDSLRQNRRYAAEAGSKKKTTTTTRRKKSALTEEQQTTLMNDLDSFLGS